MELHALGFGHVFAQCESQMGVRVAKPGGKEAVMMHTYRLVRLIEAHSEQLAGSLLEKVQNSSSTRNYHKVPPDELKQRVYDIYQHLGEWLLGKRDVDIDRRYRAIGARRFHQNVPLHELIWAIVLTKENMWEFLKDTILESQEEVFGELEVLELIGQFFDHAIYSAAKGYEHELAEVHSREVARAE
jgi:hypothetical protein